MTYAADDFSADAIAHRFNCGSWTSADVRVCIAAVRTCEQDAAAAEGSSSLRSGKEVADNRQS